MNADDFKKLLKEAIEPILRRLDSTDKGLNAVNTKLDDPVQGLNAVNKKLGDLDNGLGAVNTKLDDPVQGLNAVNKKLGDLDNGLGAVNTKLDDPVQGLNAVNKKLGDPKKGLNAVNQKLDALWEQTVKLTESAEETNETLAKHSKLLKQLILTSELHSDNFSKLDKRLTKVEDQLGIVPPPELVVIK